MVRVWIEGFRAFSEPIELELKPVTIVTGRNNCGKSSLLEAIAVASSALNGFRDALERNVVEEIARFKGVPLRYLINAKRDGARIELSNIASVELVRDLERAPHAVNVLREVYASTLTSISREAARGIESKRFTEAATVLGIPAALCGSLNQETLALLLRVLLNILIALRRLVEKHYVDANSVAHELCTSLPIEISRIEDCTARVRGIISVLLDNLHEVAKSITGAFREVTEIAVTVSFKGWSCGMLYTLYDARTHLLNTVLNTACTAIPRLRRLVIELASASGVSRVASRIKTLDLTGELEELFRSFLRKVVVESVLEAVHEARKVFEKCVTSAKDARAGEGVSTVFAMHRASWSLDELSELIDRVYRTGKMKSLRELLNAIGIEDLWRDRSGQLYASIDGEPLPLNTLGDGALNLIRLAAIHSLVDCGYVVVEEPETAMHPGYLALYAKLVLDHASKGGVTIVVSTHSHELIDYVLEHARRRCALNHVGVVHLYRSAEGIEASVYSGEEALERREAIHEDLRGI